MLSIVLAELWDEELRKRKGKPPKPKPKPKPKDGTMPSWEEYVEATYDCKCFKCPGIFANEIMNFVGFRGDKKTSSKKSYAQGELNTYNLKGNEYPGEAYPQPNSIVTKVNRENLKKILGKEVLKRNEFIGILYYEIVIMTLMFVLRNMGYEDIAVLLPRGHGKTYMNSWGNQFKMKFFSLNIMMLSVTNAKLKVGNWVYLWTLRNGYLKNPEQFARKNTYQHFELINGCRMDIYDYMAEQSLGEHDFLLVMDDTVKRKWARKPTDTERAIEQWQSNLNYIKRLGIEDWGTRKYEGDPLGHRMDTIEDMIVIKMSPFLKCPHNNLNDDGTYDMCEVCKDDALLAPEIHSHHELRGKMYEDWEAWFAEMMQNPHPTKGGMVDDEDIQYIDRPFWKEVQAICIGVDSTESDLDSTDMVGITSVAMLKNESTPYIDTNFPDMEDVPKFVALDADVRKMPFRTLVQKDAKDRPIVHRGILETIDLFIDQYLKQYLHVRLYIAIERQGGGIFIIKEVYNNREKWSWFIYLVGERKKDKKPEDLGMKEIGIRHTQEKTGRVFSELRFPIKSGQMKFSRNLLGSVLMQQVLTFPKGKHDDGVDSLGMAKDEVAKRWYSHGTVSSPYEGIIDLFKKYSGKGSSKDDFVFAPKGNAELEGIKKKSQERNRSIFG